jgi:Ca2+-binding RTX toxin-like protein
MRGSGIRIARVMAISTGIALVSGSLAGAAIARPRANVGLKVPEVATDHAKVAVDASNGSEGLRRGGVVQQEATDFSEFSQAVERTDDSSTDRASSAHASQDTTVDSSEALVTRVDSLGNVDVDGFDNDPATGDGPAAFATSEFSITFQVADTSTFFSISGVISATADPSSAECTTVTVTSPSGSTFDVAAPAGCGAPPSLSIADGGKLRPGSYTFSVVADAELADPDAAGGSAQALFDVGLDLGCSIVGTPGADSLTGTADDDMICGLGDDDTIDGLGGADTIYGGPGNNIIRGGDGSDVILGDSGADTILAGAGDDQIFDVGGSNTIQGGAGNDVILAGDDADQIVGDSPDCVTATGPAGQNDDQIFGGGGNDELFGCQGLDAIFGEGGDDRINGGSAHDALSGGKGSDKIHGDDGPDKIVGGTRKDVMFGDGADDKLFARDGVLDVVHGGSGAHDVAHLDIHDLVDGVEETLCCV